MTITGFSRDIMENLVAKSINVDGKLVINFNI